MKKQQKKLKIIPIAIRASTYERLRGYLRTHALAPSMVALVTSFIDKWLDEQEAKGGD